MTNKDLKSIDECIIGKGTRVCKFVNLYGCRIGNNCLIGSFVEIQRDAFIGNNVKIESHAFICSGVIIEDNVFIGHHVVFTNDRYPRSTSEQGTLKKENEWILEKTIIKKNASIGSNATLLPGITVGENAIVGAGSVVTKNVPENSIVTGNPAKFVRNLI